MASPHPAIHLLPALKGNALLPKYIHFTSSYITLSNPQHKDKHAYVRRLCHNVLLFTAFSESLSLNNNIKH